MVLFKIEIKFFYIINEILNKHHKIKKIQLQIGKLFNVLKTSVLQLQKDIIIIKKIDICKNNNHIKKLHIQHSDNCN